MITSRFTHVTPEMAKAWLDRNTQNRKMRRDVVDAFARDMKNGNWQTTHQGIAFDKNGVLIDGQHRLAAIVKSGVAIDLLVMRGFEPNAINYIDMGVKRRISDVIAVKYVQSPAMRSTLVISTVSKIMRHKLGYGHVPTAPEIETFEVNHPYIVDFIYRFSLKYQTIRKTYIMSSILAAAIAGVPLRHLDAFCLLLDRNIIPRDVEYNTKAVLDFKDAGPARKVGGDFLQNEKMCQQALWLFYNNKKRLPNGFSVGTIYPLNNANVDMFKGLDEMEHNAFESGDLTDLLA